MDPRVLILPTALDNYRLAVRETARKWSTEQAKAYGRLLQAGFERIAKAYARVRIKRDDRAGNSLFRLHKIEPHYAVYIVVDDSTFVIATVLHERMDVPAQLRTVERLTDKEYEALMGHPGRRPEDGRPRSPRRGSRSSSKPRWIGERRPAYRDRADNRRANAARHKMLDPPSRLFSLPPKACRDLSDSLVAL